MRAMGPETCGSILQVAGLFAGFVDFLSAVGLIVIALWKIRPAEPCLADGITGPAKV